MISHPQPPSPPNPTRAPSLNRMNNNDCNDEHHHIKISPRLLGKQKPPSPNNNSGERKIWRCPMLRRNTGAQARGLSPVPELSPSQPQDLPEFLCLFSVVLLSLAAPHISNHTQYKGVQLPCNFRDPTLTPHTHPTSPSSLSLSFFPSPPLPLGGNKTKQKRRVNRKPTFLCAMQNRHLSPSPVTMVTLGFLNWEERKEKKKKW